MIRKVLPNKMRILLIPTEKHQTCVASIFVKVGSRYESKTNNGISHFLEHMLFKDKNLVERLDCLGAKYNAETSYETTHYYIYGNKNDYLEFIEIIAKIYNNQEFKQQEVEKEKKVIIEELNMLLDNSDEIINDAINKKLFNNSSLQFPIIGTKNNIKSFTKKNLEDYYKKHYVPPNTLFVLCGNFNEKKALAKIEEQFNKIKYSDTKDYLLNEPKAIIQKEPKLHLLKEDLISQTNIMITYRAPSDSNNNKLYYDIIGDILSSGCSSRLFKLLRNKLGISYYNYSYLLDYSYEGVFIINVGVDHRRTKECIKELLQEIKELRDKGITDDELEKSKRIRETNYLLALDNPLEIVNYFGQLELFNLKNIMENLNKIKKQDINKILNKLFLDKNLNIFIHGKI